MRKKKSAVTAKAPVHPSLEILSTPLKKRINKLIAIDDILSADNSCSTDSVTEQKVNWHRRTEHISYLD